ncbi:glycosyltransferase family 4 protein [Cryomorphaceae bacterium]|nr:glycosyltransferase family 4 protein [Cryomorphaceae bacterium]
MDRPLHIVFLTQWYPHHEDVQNGIFIKHQAESLAHKHRVTVLWVGPSSQQTSITVSSNTSASSLLREVNVRYPKSRKTLGKTMGWKKAFEQIKDSVDVVHAHILDRDFPAWEVWLQAKRIPFVVHEHASFYFDRYKKDVVWHAARKRMLKRAFKVCPVSEGLKQAMIKQGLEGRYEVVPNILNVPTPSSRKKRPERLKLISVGDLVNTVKRFDEILESLVNLQGPWDYDIIGDGPNRDQLEKQAMVLFGNDDSRNVRFLGRMEQEDVQKVLSEYTMCLVNSKYETFGLIALEALNAGVPVLSPRVGVIEEFISPGVNGHFIESAADFPELIRKTWDQYDELDHELLDQQKRSDLSSEAYLNRITLTYRQLGLFVD